MCFAEAAGFEPANRFRAVNCFRGSLLQPLGHASLYFPPSPHYGGMVLRAHHRARPVASLFSARPPTRPGSSAGFPSPLATLPALRPSSDDDFSVSSSASDSEKCFVRTIAPGQGFAVLRTSADASGEFCVALGTSNLRQVCGLNKFFRNQSCHRSQKCRILPFFPAYAQNHVVSVTSGPFVQEKGSSGTKRLRKGVRYRRQGLAVRKCITSRMAQEFAFGRHAHTARRETLRWYASNFTLCEHSPEPFSFEG